MFQNSKIKMHSIKEDIANFQFGQVELWQVELWQVELWQVGKFDKNIESDLRKC